MCSWRTTELTPASIWGWRTLAAQRIGDRSERVVERTALTHGGHSELARRGPQRLLERRPIALPLLEVSQELAISIFPLLFGCGVAHMRDSNEIPDDLSAAAGRN